MEKINFEDGVTKGNATIFNQLQKNIEEAINETLNSICPIGKVEVFFDDEDHSDYLGFTWERTSLERSPIGYNPNSNDDRFKVIGNTFGDLEHEHGLSKGHAQMIDNGSTKLNFRYKYGVDYWEANNSVGITGAEQTSESLNYGIQLGGTTDSGSSLQPVEVMAFWKRVS